MYATLKQTDQIPLPPQSLYDDAERRRSNGYEPPRSQVWMPSVYSHDNYVVPTHNQAFPVMRHLPPHPSIVPPSGKPNRAVIPSKRAEQNRKAQRSFRQRRDQYVKDLERKVKDMDDWKQELDTAKDENKQLKQLVHQLQSKISSLTGEEFTLDSPLLSSSSSIASSSHLQPSTSNTQLQDVPPSSPPPLIHSPHTIQDLQPPPSPQPTKLAERCSPAGSPAPPSPQPTTFAPVSLRPHSFVPTPSPPPPSLQQVQPPLASEPPQPLFAEDDSRPFVFLSAEQQQHILEFDPFFDDDLTFPRMDDQLDFVNHSNNGQVLDDLFAMLQTRQRPQIPLQPPQQQSQDGYFMLDTMPSS
ncbi:hypothetical protein DM01DRAFT_1382019 [Hesseltinella vesiculosa]|uniref:BZIP domain-containing protein n=1 Tax=Hesseltinella vesiculosa TaxID=101127 RepID=A0A1X2GMT0_9FUNG|nr:hypothetical protein DM01DRAFT_1382019 [Hesseltinella vesiculosa]